ncbi:MAG: TonB-dependent receptor [Deltaproteobacteria bacterium]|jgi:vitamin B12 transporter|nr:TonB-dependent receptor [Deltaproteobacteria bacterium]
MRRIIVSLALVIIFWSVPSYSQPQSGGYLDIVVVTAGKTLETLREVTSNITVIDSEEIDRTAGHNLLSVLAEQGIQTYMFGATNYGTGANSTVYMRGYGQGSMSFSEVNAFTLILLNGHRINNGYANMINMDNVERVEIIRGPTAVQYGPSSLGGVINIITKLGEGPLTAHVSVGAGSFDKDEEKISLSASHQGFDFSVGASRTSFGDFTTANGNVWKHSRVDESSGIDADVGYSFLDTHRIGLHFNHMKIKGEVPGWTESLQLLYPDTFSTVDNYVWNSTLSYTGSTSDERLSWFANYTTSKSNFDSDGFYDPNPNEPFAGGSRYPVPAWYDGSNFDMNQIQAQLTYDHPIFSLSPGFEHVKYKGNALYTSGSYASLTKSEFKDTAGYLLAKLKLLDEKLIISAGGRYDSFELSNYTRAYRTTKFTPSFGIAYSPIPYLKLRANYASGFSVPNASQAFGGGTTLPNPDLKPQENTTIEFGADVSVNHFSGSVTYFISDFKNKFISVMVAPPNVMQFRNLKGADLAGLELSLNYDIAGALGQDYSIRPFFNLTWMSKYENKDPNVVVSIAPDKMPYTVDMLLSYGLNFDHPGLNLSARLIANYYGKSYVQDWYDDSYFVTYVAPWVHKEGFTVVDFSFSKRLLDMGDKGNLSLEGQFGNVFNSNGAYNRGVTIPGRNFFLSLSYDF